MLKEACASNAAAKREVLRLKDGYKRPSSCWPMATRRKTSKPDVEGRDVLEDVQDARRTIAEAARPT